MTRLTYPRTVSPRYRGFLGTRAAVEGLILVVHRIIAVD